VTTILADSLKLRAPAKINLGLRLLGVRDDGYHLLESVFAPIELWDELEVEISSGTSGIDFHIDSPVSGQKSAALFAVTGGSDNLVVRAAEAFCRQTGFEGRIGLRLSKQIPAGAGLGGGSSDAAATLVGLASLFDGDVSREALHLLGLGLGADVPFFLSPTPALVCGIGEKIEPLVGLPPLDLVLANPGISLATAEVYRAADALRGALTEPRPGSTMRAISRLRSETSDLAPALGDLLINDLEPAARRLCPPVGRLMSQLSETGAVGVSMSGSGATVFGVFESADLANRAAEALRASESDECWIRVTRIIASGSQGDDFLGA
jgi:4-diphosphocytidyl-2-C-methyl-D-erythritol kinase